MTQKSVTTKDNIIRKTDEKKRNSTWYYKSNQTLNPPKE